MDAALGGVAHHFAQVFVDERFAADKEQVADVILDADVNHVPGFFQGDEWRRFGSNWSTANPQKSHLALQILVMANWR